jgi:hypothetical protein
MKKQFLGVFFLFFAVVFLSAQGAVSSDNGSASSNGVSEQRQIVDVAADAIIKYFGRHRPWVKIEGNKVHGEAKYDKYNVKIDVTVSGNSYNIEIDSRIGDDYINKWKANLKKNIDKNLKKEIDRKL